MRDGSGRGRRGRLVPFRAGQTTLRDRVVSLADVEQGRSAFQPALASERAERGAQLPELMIAGR